ncbi:MAG: NERD domain-containing protein [Kangiellaceae bacterium]
MTQGVLLLLVALCGLSALAYYKFSFLSRSSNSRKLKKANQYLLDSEDYYLMKNVVFLTFDGLQKFDYLIVSRYGIFVVMVQHYYGVIEGTEYEKTWRQLVRGKVKKQFANPTDVINERVETISGLLSLPKSQVFPVILFDGISGFRNQLSNKFTFGSHYIKYIRSKNKLVLSANQIASFVVAIEAKRKRQGLVNEFDAKEKSQQKVSPLLQENTCPKCGSAMQIRTVDGNSATSNQQLVCQLYPTCRYKRAI